MTSIKTRLIHLLGGMTKREHKTEIDRMRVDTFFEGQRSVVHDVLEVMNGIYGNPKWGEIIYNYVRDYFHY